MKKLLIFIISVIGLVLFAIAVRCQTVENGLTVTKISQFPLISTVPSNALFVVAVPGQANYAIYAAPLANGLQTLQSNYLALSNSLFLSTNISNTAIQDGYTLSQVTSSAGSNTYWEDFGKTNTLGQSLINARLTATNDVVFYGPTNMNRTWQCLSYGVLAAGINGSGYVRIWIPTNGLQLFSTNYGQWTFYVSNQWDVLYLTNGHKFRDSMQTNDIWEHQWIVK